MPTNTEVGIRWRVCVVHILKSIQVQGTEVAATGACQLRKAPGARRAVGQKTDVQDDPGVCRGAESAPLQY